MLSQPVEMDTGQSMGKVQDTDCIVDLSQCTPAYDDEELMSNFSDETRVRYLRIPHVDAIAFIPLVALLCSSHLPKHNDPCLLYLQS